MANFTALKTAINNAIKTNGNEEITGAVLQVILDAMVETLGESAITNLENALSDEITNRQNAVSGVADDLAAEALARAAKDNQLDGRINQEEYNRANADAALSQTMSQGFQTLGSQMTALNAAISALNAAYQNGFLYGGIATPSSSPSNGKCFYIALQGGTYTNFGGVGVLEGINIIKNDSGWKVEHIYDQTTLLNEFYLLRQQVIRAISSIDPIVIQGDVTNAPDEEDLTSDAQHLLKFKDRAYSPLNFSGLGMKILRKNIAPLSDSAPFNGFVEGVTAEETLSGTPTQIFWDRMNTRFVGIKDGVYYLDWTGSDNYVPASTSLVYMYNGTPYQWTGSDFIVDEDEVPNLVNCLTQDMINEANTIYIIRYDYTLKEDITIPANCVLQFDGGSIKGGSITLSEGSGIINGKLFHIPELLLVDNCRLINCVFDKDGNNYNGVIKVNGNNIIIRQCSFSGYAVDSVEYPSVHEPNIAVIRTNWLTRNVWYNNLIIEDCYFGNYTCDSDYAGRAILIHEVYNCIIRNNVFDNISNTSNSSDFDIIQFLSESAPNTDFPYVDIQHPDVHGTVENNIFNVLSLKSCVKVQAGDVKVSGNTFNVSGVRNYIRAYQSDKVIISNNKCIGTSSYSFELFGTNNSIIQDNYVYNSQTGSVGWYNQNKNLVIDNNEFICYRGGFHYNNVEFIVSNNRVKLLQTDTSNDATNYVEITENILPSILLINNTYDFVIPSNTSHYNECFIGCYNSVIIKGCIFKCDYFDNNSNKRASGEVTILPYKNTILLIEDSIFDNIKIIGNTNFSGSTAHTKPTNISQNDFSWGSVSIYRSKFFTFFINSCDSVNIIQSYIQYRYSQNVLSVNTNDVIKLYDCSFYAEPSDRNVELIRCKGYGLSIFNDYSVALQNKFTVGTRVFSNVPVYWNGTKWIHSDGVTKDTARSGSDRPLGTDIYIGFQFFDTSLSPARPIYASNINGDTVTWVDATGATV